MPRSGRRAGVITSWALVTLATGTLSACGGATATGIEPAARRPAPAAVDNASKPGEPVAEPATFHSLGVRWAVRGDANSDAVIGVRYRRHGETTWREALPLFRTDPESVSEDNRVLGGWLFAGSIVDLAPDTAYEVTLALIDPDGGGVERALDMKTGAEPREPAGMRVQHVVPAGGADRGPGTGTPTDPFRGLRIAQAPCWSTPAATSRVGSARPGPAAPGFPARRPTCVSTRPPGRWTPASGCPTSTTGSRARPPISAVASSDSHCPTTARGPDGSAARTSRSEYG
jgi:hypothetical protein